MDMTWPEQFDMIYLMEMRLKYVQDRSLNNYNKFYFAEKYI